MKSTARLERPEEIEVTITFTMPLAAWKLIRRDLVKIGGNISEPARELSSGIAELVVRTEQTLLGVEPPVAKDQSDKEEPRAELPQAAAAAPAWRRPAAGAVA